jgi:glycosidase
MMKLQPHPLLLALALACVVPVASLAQPTIDISAQPARPTPSRLPEGWQNGVFMEVFVRAYADSDGDGQGDLRGLTAKLDYLQSLGVRGLWLMPITANADGDHGYATTDFRRIHPGYGTLADFDELIAQAHARGIGVIVDYVVNHSAAQHPMFEAARQGPQAPWRDWFVWSEPAPKGWDIWGKNPWYHTASQPWLWTGEVKDMPAPAADAKGFYFGTFGPAMPDFNFRNPQVVNYHFDSMRFWLNRGLDGFRLDAVPHLIENNAVDWNDQPESRALTLQIQQLVKSYPGRHTVCEATANPRAYAAPSLCGSAFAFGIEDQFVKAAKGEPDAIAKVADYVAKAPATMAYFVSNHDQFAGQRLWDQAGGDEAVYKLTAATYLMLPGTPFVYFGEEIGQAGATGLVSDPAIRSPMSWTADARTAGFTTGTPYRPTATNVARQNVAAELARPQGLLSHYKALIALRNQWPAISRGSFEHAMAQGATLSFQRKLGDEHLVLGYNYGKSSTTLQIPGLPAGAQLRALNSTPTETTVVVADQQGVASLSLPAQSFAAWQVKKP